MALRNYTRHKAVNLQAAKWQKTCPNSVAPAPHAAGPGTTAPLITNWCQFAVLTLYLLVSSYLTFCQWRRYTQGASLVVLKGTLHLEMVSRFLLLFGEGALLPLLLYRAFKLRPSRSPKMRVAMIATKVPSEPLDMLKDTLSGMLEQDYPYPFDVWLADEQPDEATKEWCKQHGVHISCRCGIQEYHRPEWPRRTRCKEGNLAYFYDHWGYAQYDVVCQFDADHKPEPGYLRKLLPAFLDPEVGYATAPSICDSNANECWAAKGRLWVEAAAQGAYRSAVSGDWLPLAVGSHYAVRTSALKAAGGLGPELDEDLSTSYMMAAAGYQGVYCADAIAHGEGPSTFGDAMHQEYQWARSAMILMVQFTSPYWARLTWRQKLRLAATYSYWINATLQVALELLRLLELLLNPDPVALLKFRVHTFSLTAAVWASSVLLTAWMKSQGWLRPVNAPIFSWQALLFQFTVPWWVARGTIHGLMGALLGNKAFSFKVTRKALKGTSQPFHLSYLLPYLGMALGAMALLPASPGSALLVVAAGKNMTAAASLVLLHAQEAARCGLPAQFRLM